MSSYVTDKMTHSHHFYDESGAKAAIHEARDALAQRINAHGFGTSYLLPDTQKTTILRRNRHFEHNKKEEWHPDYDPSLPLGGLSPEDAAMNESAYLFDTEKYTDPWAKTQTGRTMVRLFSRGLLGSSFYMLGQRAAGRQLAEYHWSMPLSELPGGANILKYPLRYIARGFDLTYGKAVEKGAKIALTPFKGAEAAEKGAHNVFIQRNSTYFTSQERLADLYSPEVAETFWNKLKEYGPGRSSGHEAVALTFDFAMGSTGDALGRYVARLTHPNTWEQYKDDNGKFKLSNVINDFGKTGWKIFSFNQMEDWAAAPLYVLQMRFQRRVLNKLFPGFEYNADLQKNGAGHVFNSDGQAMRSFALPGLIDLQFRFMGYNWYTLMFRDGYKAIGNGIDAIKKDGISAALPEINTLNPFALAGDALSGTWSGAQQLTKYSLRSLIKSQIYMAPAVPFFWFTRTPQTMPNGIPLLQDSISGEIAPMTLSSEVNVAERAASYEDMSKKGRALFSSLSATEEKVHIARPVGGVGIVGRILHGPGKLCEMAGEFMVKGTKWMEPLFKVEGTFKNAEEFALKQAKSHEGFMRGFTNASISYTPYMIMKRETARLYDNKLMDDAIDKMLEGAAQLNPNKAYSGLRTVENLVTHPPLSLFENVANQNKYKYAEKRGTKIIEENKDTVDAANTNREPLQPKTANTHRIPTVKIEGAVLDKPAYAGLTSPATPEQAAASREVPDSSIDAASLEPDARIALDPEHVSHSIH